MRLWHKDLIPVLPRKQLLGQWRECCLIAKNIIEKGTPNHLLVNRIMDYPPSHFYEYAREIWDEMHRRGYNCFFGQFEKYIHSSITINHEKIFEGWHNSRYFLQCYHNLQEKYDCGGINGEEWELVHKKFLEEAAWIIRV